MNVDLMWASLPALLAGLPLTLQLVSLSLLLGFGLAVLLALMRLSDHPLITAPASAFVFVFRGTPLIVQLFLIYYGLGQIPLVRETFLWTLFREPFWCAILAYTMNTAAYTSEIIRGGIQSVPFGQIEAAKAAGMGRALCFRRVIFPQAIRQALPAYGNEIILIVKGSSIASTITLMEVTGIARGIMSKTFAPIEIFIIAGSIYLLINFAVTRAIKALEYRLAADLRPPPDATTLRAPG